MKKLSENFVYLKEMYDDTYFPPHLVDKIRDLIREIVAYIEKGDHTKEEIQSQLDRIVREINDLEGEFNEADSEIETVARDSIGTTIDAILQHFGIDIDLEEAIRERDW